MQLDLFTLFPVSVGIAIAVVIAVVAGTLAARLFFDASGLAPKDAAGPGEKPPR
jgi:hypothetical protein